MNQQVTKICKDFIHEINEVIGSQKAEDIFILTDDNTQKFCLPELLKSEKLRGCHLICIPSGDENKNIESAVTIWKYLSEHGANRKSLMINLGGGMITDIGGLLLLLNVALDTSIFQPRYLELLMLLQEEKQVSTFWD